MKYEKYVIVFVLWVAAPLIMVGSGFAAYLLLADPDAFKHIAILMMVTGLALSGISIFLLKYKLKKLNDPTLLNGVVPAKWLRDNLEEVRSWIPESFIDAKDIDYQGIVSKLETHAQLNTDAEFAMEFLAIISHTGLYEQRIMTGADGVRRIYFRSTRIQENELDMKLGTFPVEEPSQTRG